ncbi:MAG: hypothetical protein E6G75_19810 [Alphaproteobacteria bacterium]|nr:MAG: hypothetical protein E6G75_19810 [Alphaproteobacteria bacterium]
MRNARLIQDFRDTNYRPTRRTIADGLARLEQELGAKLDIGLCHLHVPHQPSGTALFATLWYRSYAGDDIIIAYPFSKGCRARTTSGARVNLSLDQLDGALIDEDANVLLSNGRSVRALEFDVLPHPKDFTDLEHAIVFLTVRFLEAEDIGFRYMPEPGLRGIDYSRMSELSVSNVKALARYIAAHIGKLPRGDEEPPLGPVSLNKIQNTLAMAGVRKVRGRKPKKAD